MNITELDEWQGITEDMVRGWLLSHGWELAKTGNGSIDAKKRFADRVTVLGCHWETCLGWLLVRVSAAHALNVQALLREINPRMRKGWPSGEALAMHDRWIVSKPEGVVIMCRWRPPYMVNAAGGGDLTLREQCEHWSFWPCDANGNKVRWPTDAEGNML